MVEGDLSRALRRVRAAALLLVAAALVFVATGFGGSDGRRTAERDASSCSQAVLGDWADGSFDRRHPADCYLAAIDSLPEDVRTYTSAEDDITRALQAATRTPAAGGQEPRKAVVQRYLSSAPHEEAEPASPSSLRSPPAPVALLGTLGSAALAAGLVVVLASRFRRDR